MNDFNFFIKVIEEVRKSRHISIEDLTEGIVSARSYIRYVHNQQEVRTSIVEKLLLKLDLKFSEIIFHYIHKSAGQSDMNMFMIHFKRGHFDLCEPYYAKLKLHIDENLDYKYLIEAYLALYEFRLNRIDEGNFVRTIRQLKSKIESYPVKTMYHHYFMILYTIYVDDGSTNILAEMDFLLEEDNVSKRILQYLYLIPEVVKYMIKIASPSSLIEKLIEVHKRALLFRQDLFCEYDSFYIQALYYHYIGDEISKENALFKFCFMRNVTGDTSNSLTIDQINDYFKVSCQQIIMEKLPPLK